MEKKIRGIYMEDANYEKLKEISKANKRSCSAMVEILVIQAYEEMVKEGK